MEMECVLLLSDHCKWIMPFHKSALSHPKWSAKSALSLASHKRKGVVKLYSAQEKLRSAVLSEVLNGTDHLRGVGVLVVVPRHDLNLIGVVVATLNFHDFFVVVHNFETTVTVPQHTVVVPKPACSYQNYTTFRRYFQGFPQFCVFGFFHFRTFYAYGFSCDIVLTLRSVRDPGLPPGRSPCPDALLRVGVIRGWMMD